MAVWGEKSCLNARWMNEQMNEWSDKWKGCDGLPSDLGGCSQEILTPKWSECMGGDVKGIFRVAVQAPSVCPNHAYLSTSDNVSVPVEVWTRILPYLNAPATRYETFSLTIEMNHGQWAQLRYGTAFFFFSFQVASWDQSTWQATSMGVSPPTPFFGEQVFARGWHVILGCGWGCCRKLPSEQNPS